MEVKEDVLFADTDVYQWGSEMSIPGTFVDHFWLQACANYVGSDIVLIPTFSQSATEIGQLIRIHALKKKGFQPLFWGYMEDNLYSAGHLRAIIPTANNSIVQYLETGEPIDRPEPSTAFPLSSCTTVHIPLANLPEKEISYINGGFFRNRLFTNELNDSTLIVNSSTERFCECEDDSRVLEKQFETDVSSYQCHV